MESNKPESNTYRPVSLQFSNIFGNDPYRLPTPGQRSVYGVKSPMSADSETQYMLSDGSIWKYLGISAYRCDNIGRINGWELVWKP